MLSTRNILSKSQRTLGLAGSEPVIYSATKEVHVLQKCTFVFQYSSNCIQPSWLLL